MKKICRCMAWCVVFLFATTLAWAGKQPEMMCSVPFFIEQYNKTAPDMGLSFLNANAVRDKAGAMDTHQIYLTRYSVVTMATNPGGKSLTSLVFNGAGDGTEQSGLAVMASLMNTVAAVLDDYTPEQLHDVFNRLGFFDDRGIVDPKKVRAGRFVFSLSNDDTAGIRLTVGPASS